jgi:hypothetical protein
LGSYLNRTFGAPDININITGTINAADIQNQMQNRIGIIMFRVAGWDDAVGHFDMWNGSNAKNASYFKPKNGTLTGVSIWFLDKQSQR